MGGLKRLRKFLVQWFSDFMVNVLWCSWASGVLQSRFLPAECLGAPADINFCALILWCFFALQFQGRILPACCSTPTYQKCKQRLVGSWFGPPQRICFVALAKETPAQDISKAAKPILNKKTSTHRFSTTTPSVVTKLSQSNHIHQAIIHLTVNRLY